MGGNRTYRGKQYLLASLAFGLAAGGASAWAAPSPPLISLPTQHAFVGDSLVQISGTLDGSATMVRIVEGSTVLAESGPFSGYWSASVGLADGSHTIRAYARDAVGTWSAGSAPRTFVVDTVNPDPPAITSPADGALLGFSRITVEGATEPYAHVVVTDEVGPVLETNADGSGAWAVTHDFGDVEHRLTAVAIDQAGNESLPSAVTSLTVDTLAPGVPAIGVPGPGSFTNSTSVLVAGNAEPGALVKVFEGATILMTVPASDGTWSGTVDVAAGAHTISARAFDAAGNASTPSADVTFTVDLTPPAAPTLLRPAPGSYVATPVTVAGGTEPFARVELRSDTTYWAQYADRYGAFAFTLDLGSGPYEFTVRATDLAGNTGAESAPLAFTADAGAPEVTLETPYGTIFLPGRFPLIRGRAYDDVGVAGVRLDYYDLFGKLAYRQTALCGACPVGTEVTWVTDREPPIGRFEVYAYAIDRVGHESLPAKTTIVNL